MENRVPVYLDDEHTQIYRTSRLFWQPVMLSGMPMVIVFLLKLSGKRPLAVGSGKLYPHGDSVDNKTAYYDKGVGKTTAVGSYPANDYGLHDMAGNVWEICWDWYLKDWYSQPGAVAKNPRGPDVDSLNNLIRIVRGGSGASDANRLKVHYRRDFNLTWSQYLIGFRTVISEPPSTPAIDITALSTPVHLGTVSGGGIFPNGQEVSLVAKPTSGGEFLRWSTGETTQVITFTATEDANVTAFFKPGGSGQIYNSVIAQANDASLGSVIGTGIYLPGSEITIEAIPNEGAAFYQWTGDLSGFTNPLTLTVSSDLVVHATFEDAYTDTDVMVLRISRDSWVLINQPRQ